MKKRQENWKNSCKGEAGGRYYITLYLHSKDALFCRDKKGKFWILCYGNHASVYLVYSFSLTVIKNSSANFLN